MKWLSERLYIFSLSSFFASTLCRNGVLFQSHQGRIRSSDTSGECHSTCMKKKWWTIRTTWSQLLNLWRYEWTLEYLIIMSQILCSVLYILVLLVPPLCFAFRKSLIQMFNVHVTLYNEFLCPLSLVDKNLSSDLLYGDEPYFPQFGDSVIKDLCDKQHHMYVLDGIKGTYMATVHYTIPWRWRQCPIHRKLF